MSNGLPFNVIVCSGEGWPHLVIVSVRFHDVDAEYRYDLHV
jgi:hypothetical protein